MKDSQDVDQNVAKSLQLLRTLCDEPALFINTRMFYNNWHEPSSFTITIANKQPSVDEATFVARYPKDTVAVDLITESNPSDYKTNLTKHWIHILCAVLVFRGHEVYLDNKVYQPAL